MLKWTKGQTPAGTLWGRGQNGQVRGIYTVVAGIVFAPPGFMLAVLTLALVSELWNIRRPRYRRLSLSPMNELRLCGSYQQVTVQRHKTHALCTGERPWSWVWADFHLDSTAGTNKHLKKQQQGVGFRRVGQEVHALSMMVRFRDPGSTPEVGNPKCSKSHIGPKKNQKQICLEPQKIKSLR